MAQESLFISLALEQISYFTSPHLPREEADSEQQFFIARLSADDEKQLIREYLNLQNETFTSLSPQVHVWFLRRLLRNINLLITTERISRLVALYFQYPGGLVRHKVVEVFYALDQQYFNRGDSSTSLFDIVRHVQKQVLNHQPSLLRELTEILVDVSLQAKLKDVYSYDQQSIESIHDASRFSTLEQFIDDQSYLGDFPRDHSIIQSQVAKRFHSFDRNFLKALLDKDKNEILSQFVDNMPASFNNEDVDRSQDRQDE